MVSPVTEECYFHVKSYLSSEKTLTLKLAAGMLIEQMKCVVKSSTPLNSLMSLTWDFPVDPMHQVFLGTGKVLTKMMISLLKGETLMAAENLIKRLKVPFDVKHKPKALSELNFWQAFDFKLFFFS